MYPSHSVRRAEQRQCQHTSIEYDGVQFGDIHLFHSTATDAAADAVAVIVAVIVAVDDGVLPQTSNALRSYQRTPSTSSELAERQHRPTHVRKV